MFYALCEDLCWNLDIGCIDIKLEWMIFGFRLKRASARKEVIIGIILVMSLLQAHMCQETAGEKKRNNQ